MASRAYWGITRRPQKRGGGGDVEEMRVGDMVRMFRVVCIMWEWWVEDGWSKFTFE